MHRQEIESWRKDHDVRERGLDFVAWHCRREEEHRRCFYRRYADRSRCLWPVPEWLRCCRLRWARTLVRMYRHPGSFPGSLSPEAGLLIRSLVSNLAPRHAMEIGSFLGVSSIWIASAMAESGTGKRLSCVDLFPNHEPLKRRFLRSGDPLRFMQTHVRRAGLDSIVDAQRGDSRVLAPELARRLGAPLDFLYIDGDHSVEGCLADFRLLEPFVCTGGYILLHDVFPCSCQVDGPAYVIDNEIAPSERFELIRLHTTPEDFGFALMRKLRTA